MSRYNLIFDPHPLTISHYHETYFRKHNPRYALLYRNNSQLLFVNLELESEDTSYLALTLNAEVKPESDMVNTTYLESYEDFYTPGSRIVK